MPRVAWPIVRALVVARVGEIAWSPARELLMMLLLTVGASIGAIATGLAPSWAAWVRVLFFVLTFQFGTELYTAASPAGMEMFDFNQRLRRGHTMPHLPAGALERLAATTLLAAPLSVPLVAAVLLGGWLRHNDGRSTVLHLAFVLAGFATRGTSKHLSLFDPRLERWSTRLLSSLRLYGSPRGGEVAAAFWALAVQSVYGPAVVFGATVAVVCTTPALASILGVVHGSVAIVGMVTIGVAISALSLGDFIGPLSRLAISRRAFALAALQVVLILSALSGAPAIALAAMEYGSAAGARGALELLVTLLAFEGLAVVAIARFTPAATPGATTLLVAAPLAAVQLTTPFIAALTPSLMPFVGAVAAVAFVLALLLAFTAPRDPLSREPTSIVGAARRLLGAA